MLFAFCRGFFLTPLERKTGLGLALRASGRDPLSTPSAPERGALRSRGQAPGMPCINNKRENRIGSPFAVGAENGTRTRDLNLGKVALYQLSYFRMVFVCECKGRQKIRISKFFMFFHAKFLPIPLPTVHNPPLQPPKRHNPHDCRMTVHTTLRALPCLPRSGPSAAHGPNRFRPRERSPATV